MWASASLLVYYYQLVPGTGVSYYKYDLRHKDTRGECTVSLPRLQQYFSHRSETDESTINGKGVTGGWRSLTFFDAASRQLIRLCFLFVPIEIISNSKATMKLSVAVSCLLLSNTLAFNPVPFSARTTRLQSTAAPERIAPDAGYEPEWENRPGLSPEEFMASDMSKPDASGMWECPLTRWDSDG